MPYAMLSKLGLKASLALITLTTQGGTGTGGTAISADDSWSLSNLLTNAATLVKSLGGLLIALLGVVMLVVAGVKIAKGLMGGQNSQPPNWLMIVCLIIVGGCFAAGGLSILIKLGSGGQKTLNELGTGGTSSNTPAQSIITELPEGFSDSAISPWITVPDLN